MRRPKIAFVGSGGATKGIAHLGVLRAIEELGLEVDVFVGASAGAIASSFFAQNTTADEMVDWFRPFWSKRYGGPRSMSTSGFLGFPNEEQLSSLGYLTTGLFSIDHFERFLAKALPSNDFRQIEKNLIVTATDVDGRGRVVFGRGYRDDVPISQAVAASSCVPLLYRPYKIGDRYYADGELVRTLSLDLAVEAGADVVIVSNVYRPHVTRPGEASLVHEGLSGMVRQTMNIVLSEKEKRGIDLINRLYPHVTVLNVSADLGRYSFTSTSNARKLLTRGYREALRVLAAAKRRGVFDVASNVHTVGQA